MRVWKDEMGDRALPLRPLSERDAIQLSRSGGFVPVTPFRTFDFGDTLDPFVAACCAPQPLANAFGMLEALAEKRKFRTSGAAKALYVMGLEGEDGVSKIGVSTNAVKRLPELQSAHYRRLYLYGVAFLPKHNAVKVEQGVLSAASERGERLCGEWLQASVDSVLREALGFARDNGVPISDGQTWFEDMSRRTVEIARGQKFRKAA